MDYYYEGKKARLDGKPCEVPLSAGEVGQCDYRSGYRVADTSLKNHPEWSHDYILNDPPRDTVPQIKVWKN